MAVIETGSVRGAAERLVVTQPAVSASLAALEKQVGAKLVARAGRGIAVTESGELLGRYARQILALVDEATAAIDGKAGGAPATMRLGVVTSAHHLVGQLLAGVDQLTPRIGIELEVGNRVRIWQLLNSRGIDLAVTGRPPSTGEFVAIASRPNELVLVARPGVVWRDKLGEAMWLVRERGSGARASIEEVIAQNGIDPPRTVIGSNAAIKTAAEAGLGAALLPYEAVADSLVARTLVRIEASGTPRSSPWYVVARAGEELPAPARTWLTDLLARSESRFADFPSAARA